MSFHKYSFKATRLNLTSDPAGEVNNIKIQRKDERALLLEPSHCEDSIFPELMTHTSRAFAAKTWQQKALNPVIKL